MPFFFRLINLSLLMALCAYSSQAQSTDRDNPTRLTTNEIRGQGTGVEVDYYYSFIAGPGEVTVTVDATAAKTPAAVANLLVQLFDSKANDLMRASVITNKTEREVKQAQVARRQEVVLRLRVGEETGSFRVQVSGATQIPTSVLKPSGQRRIDLPQSGTLRLEMQDGSTHEFSVSKVRTLSIVE